jgi:hypothetical protein
LNVQASSFQTITFTQAQTAGIAATYKPQPTVATAGVVQIGNAGGTSVLSLVAPLQVSSAGLTFSSFSGSTNVLQLSTFGVSAPNGGTLSLGVASGAVTVLSGGGGLISGAASATLTLAACNITDVTFAGFAGAISKCICFVPFFRAVLCSLYMLYLCYCYLSISFGCYFNLCSVVIFCFCL